MNFLLNGTEDDTDVFSFPTTHRKIFQRGYVDAFLLPLAKLVEAQFFFYSIDNLFNVLVELRPLGSLNFLHIWHDNSGKHDSASWFLKYVLVRDLQTQDLFYFICEQWLAVEKGDGKVNEK